MEDGTLRIASGRTPTTPAEIEEAAVAALECCNAIIGLLVRSDALPLIELDREDTQKFQYAQYAVVESLILKLLAAHKHAVATIPRVALNMERVHDHRRIYDGLAIPRLTTHETLLALCEDLAIVLCERHSQYFDRHHIPRTCAWPNVPEPPAPWDEPKRPSDAAIDDMPQWQREEILHPIEPLRDFLLHAISEWPHREARFRTFRAFVRDEQLKATELAKMKSPAPEVASHTPSADANQWVKSGPPPRDWFGTSLEGSLKDLTRWCGETNEQTIRSSNGTGFWVCKIHRTKYSVHFPNQSRFADANGRKRAEEQAAKARQSPPKPAKANIPKKYH
jgi:hypothetical protein